MKGYTSRRQFLLQTVASGAVLAAYNAPAFAGQTIDEQGWRYCTSCGVLFHLGSGRGACPNNPDGHAAAGFEFRIRYSDGGCRPDTDKTQSRWRKCSNCLSMYYNGEGAPRVCPVNGAHSRDTSKCYIVPTNRLHGPALNPVNNFNQGDWRYCGRCSGMFFDGFLDNKGVCPAGGTHAALGDFFVLPHF